MLRVVALGVVWLLFATGCAGSDAANVASGSGPIVTTPPLAVPPAALAVPGDDNGSESIATTAPVDVAEPTAPAPTAAATLTPAPIDPTPLPTEVPAEAVATAVVVAAPTEVPAEAVATAVVVAPTQVPGAASTAVPVPEATAVPAPAPVTTGSGISLGDFEVVNLVTRQNQNIAELGPSGPTMLWFWAPH